MVNNLIMGNLKMYKKVVVALDLSESSNKILQAAIQFADGDSGKIELLHVVESIPTTYGMESFAVDLNQIQDQIMDASKQELQEFAGKHNIGTDRTHTVLGSPATEIRGLAEDLGADAIVLGSHGRSGWKLMLGSTANKVLHGAKCDVLTVHVEEES